MVEKKKFIVSLSLAVEHDIVPPNFFNDCQEMSINMVKFFRVFNQIGKRYKSRVKYFSLFLSLIFTSCVTPFNFDNKISDPKLVIEGWITDNPGSTYVKITNTIKIGNDNPWVKNAEVSIIDDLQNQTKLKINSEGKYLPAEGFKGQAGRSYFVEINIGEKTYQSKPELLKAVTAIDSLYYEFREQEGMDEEGFYVYIDFTDPENESNNYSWKTESHILKKYCGTAGLQAPPDIWHQIFYIRCCTPCWDIIHSKGRDIFTDTYINGTDIKKKRIAILPYNDTNPAILRVVQNEISKEAYGFYNQLNKQLNNSGTVFDTPPFAIVGNISNVDDPFETVLGYCAVAGENSNYYKIIRINVGRVPTNNDGIHNNPALSSVDQHLSSKCIECPISSNTTTIPPPLFY